MPRPKVKLKTFIYRPDLGLPSKCYTYLCFDKKGNTLSDHVSARYLVKEIKRDVARYRIMEGYYDGNNVNIFKL